MTIVMYDFGEMQGEVLMTEAQADRVKEIMVLLACGDLTDQERFELADELAVLLVPEEEEEVVD